MVETIVFIKALSVSLIILFLLCGISYWISYFIKKSFPYLRYVIKYKILRRKYNKNLVIEVMNFLNKGLSEEKLFKFMLLDREFSLQKAKECLYIYREIKKLKGGNIQ